MRFQIKKDKFILQSFYKEMDNIYFNIGFIDNSKVIKYENVIYSLVTRQVAFRNTEFLKNDRNIIQVKVLENIIPIMKIIIKEL